MIVVSYVNKLTETPAATAVGGLLAAGWYVSAQALLSGTAAQILPVAGAITLAAITPHVLRKAKGAATPQSRYPNLSERISAMNQHVMVNVVNNHNLISEVNDHMLEITGYSRDELVGQPVKMLYTDNDGQALADSIRSDLIAGKTWRGQTPLRRSDGQIVFADTTVLPLFDDAGNWTGSISARTDVTRMNQLMAGQETADSLDELGDDIWILDAESHRFTYMNKSALRRVAWGAGDVISKHVVDIPCPDCVSTVTDACAALRATGETMTQLQAHVFDTPFMVTIKHLQVGEEADRYLIMLNDISTRLKEDRQKSDFIAMVSHELRSPLTSIKGSMGLLLSNAAGELPDKAKTLLEIAHRNADRLVLIINDILDLEKISAGQMEFDRATVDVSALVRETNDANHMLHQRFKVEVEVTGDQTPIMVNTDPNRIIQVLNNFVSNACKFSKPGGKVHLTIDDNGESVRVGVRDHGAGIPPEDHDKIFQRFADLTNSDRAAKGGTGLGLSICKGIVENLGGTIGFETEVGAGTTFYFVLPKAQEDAQTGAEDTDLRAAS